MEGNHDVSNSLVTAVREGNLERARELIHRFGLSHSQAWSGGYNLLREALQYKHTAVAKLLLESGSIVNSENSRKNPCDTLLHFAVRNGDIEIVKMILDRDAAIEAKNGSGRTPLYYAIVYNKIEVTELLLKYKADVNAISDNSGTSLLRTAVDRGYLQIVDHLLSHGADVNYVNTGYSPAGYTSLHFAAGNGNKEMIKLLLSKGANVDIKDEDNVTPLHVAAKEGFVDIAEDLLNHGACINSCTLAEGYTPLHYASERGNEKMVKFFLNKGADIDAITNDNSTPLHIATKRGRETVVKLLLQHGAKVDHQDKDGKTTLHLAVEKGYLTIVGDLLKNGADVNTSYNSTFKKGFTLLHSAAKNEHKEVAQLLISYGADVNAQDKTGKTPIFYAIWNADFKITNLLLTNGANIKDCPDLLNIAVQKGCIEIVEALLQHDADINASDKDGRTALHSTAYGQSRDINIQDEIAKLLLSKGANIDAQTVDGKTTLYTAIQYGNEKVVEALLEYNANVNSRVLKDITPLHFSVQRGNREISMMLLNKGADVNAKQEDGMTALHIAAKWGREEVAKLLLEYGAQVDSKMKSDSTPLHLASQKGHVNVVVTLLEYGSDINITNIDNHTPLDEAIARGSSNISFNNYRGFGSCETPAEALKCHVIKMKTANLYVSEKNLLSIHSFGEISDFQDECEKEIASMKREKINNLNISFYDILAKSTSLLVGYMMNENIVRVLKSDDYKTTFPIYADMIKSQFRKGMERKELHDNKIYHLLFNYFPELPYECTEKIFSYLSNEELRILIGGCKPFSISNPNANIDDV